MVVTGVVGMSGINGVNLTITVINLTSFSIGINTTGSGTYVSGGTITPNLRNVSVSINDYPDTYLVTYVNPPQQVVGITATWNTISTNFISPAAISQLATPALVSYINAITVGQPINLLLMSEIFQQAIATVLPTSLLDKLVFVVTVDGTVTSPSAGTSIIPGDPESYFFTTAAGISVVQG